MTQRKSEDQAWAQRSANVLDIMITVAVLAGTMLSAYVPVWTPLIIAVWCGLVACRLVIRFAAWE